MESPVVAALVMGVAVLSLSLGGFIMLGGLAGTMQRRVDTFVKAAPPAQVQDLAGGRRRAAHAAIRPETRNATLRRIEDMIERAQVELKAIEVVYISLGLAVAFFVLAAIISGQTLAGIPAAILGAYVPILWLKRRYGGLADKFHKQLADTTTLLASSVRAGNALPKAFERVSSEAPEPTRSAFRLGVREMGLGLPLEDALDRIAERYPSEEMELLVASVNVQYQVGGNLSKVLELISDTLRERQRILGDIKSLTATQRYSAILLSLLPVVVTAGLFFLSPSYVGILFQGPYRIILVIASVLVGLGYFLMQQLSKVDV